MQITINTPDVGLTDQQLREAVMVSLMGLKLKRVLLLPPDITRLNSGAGKLTAMYYEALKESCEVKIMPALGTHVPMTREEQTAFFGSEIPEDCFLVHDWRAGVEKIGEVPGEFVKEVSQGLMDSPIDVEVSTQITQGEYDLVLSIGQVVPHEVVGMANYTKNILVGCGGSRMINASHMLGAFYGLERIMGRDFSPVRRVFDYAEEHFLKNRFPIVYVLTVTTTRGAETDINGLYVGRKRELFEAAVKLSQKLNVNYVDRPLQRVVVYLDPREFRSTWLGNKAVYRTRMAMADGGELYVVAPGVDKFGEDPENDALIRKYGYRGRERILELTGENRDLQENLSVAAHLIHGSSDGRFSVTYCTEKLTKEEVEAVGFRWMDAGEAAERFELSRLREGPNTLPDGTELFYIKNPALGLWAERRKLEGGEVK